MNKIKVEVPSDVKYISEWKDYQIPLGKCIIDKGVTGCGFTEFCLRNSENLILCSPRKLLLENKVEQHPGEPNILYLKNDLEKRIEYDGDEMEVQLKNKVNTLLFYRKPAPVVDYKKLQEDFNQRIAVHRLGCRVTQKAIKFLVTYDSLKYLITALGDEVSQYKVVVDEFQSIFLDSHFKANTELDFLDYLQGCPNVCYLSATPMLDRYLEKLDEFKDLDFYEFKWTNFVERAKIEKRLVPSSFQCIKKVILQYQSGEFPTLIDDSRGVHESHEAVIYLNSVTDILKLINSCGLTTQNTDVICADTEKNRRKLKKKGFGISKPNTEENMYLNKMFTFCTRTVYLGADFYSDNATSWVMCNPNCKHLAVDISLDLPQIIGRQRRQENPWKNQCVMFYQITQGLVSKKDYDNIRESKMIATEKLFEVYNSISNNPSGQAELVRKFRDSANYCGDYLGVSKKRNCPAYNRLVLLAEERAWDVVQVDYLSEINVRSALQRENLDVRLYDQKDLALVDLINTRGGKFEDKIRAYCKFRETEERQEIIDAVNSRISNKYSSYYNLLGSGGIGTCRFEEALIKEKISNTLKLSGVSQELKKYVFPGQRYSFKTLKELIKIIYDSLGITLTPKASEIEKYFEVKACQITVGNKKTHGYKIIKAIL